MIQLHKHKRIPVPPLLRDIPDSPDNLYCIGDNLQNLLRQPRVAIVGSRQMSPYGKAVTSKLATFLVRHNIVIVSGLAFGVDACAHRAALEAGGRCIVVQANGLDALYPASHLGLANQIVMAGGVIISEHPAGVTPQKHLFLRRNRLISGLADAVVITEAAQRSGTLNTAAHALNQGRPVLAVPGDITNPLAAGTNGLIKAGATPLTSIEDVQSILGIPITDNNKPAAANREEKTILQLLSSGIENGDELLKSSKLPISTFNQTLTMLEITGKIKPLGNNQWSLQ